MSHKQCYEKRRVLVAEWEQKVKDSYAKGRREAFEEALARWEDEGDTIGDYIKWLEVKAREAGEAGK